jgi:primosomal protein N' (replication factor Y)
MNDIMIHTIRQAQILLPLPGVECFDYRIPEDMELAVGDIVEVPFRNRQSLGVVWGLKAGGLEPAKLKTIQTHLESNRIAENLCKFIDRVAEYSFAAPGSILKMVLSVPAALKPLPYLAYYLPDSSAAQRITPERQKIIECFSDQQPRPLKRLAEQAGVSPAVLASMRKSGMLREVMMDAPPVPPVVVSLPPLSPAQAEAAEALQRSIYEGYSVTVLDGVTGSGKTEVYFAAIAEVLTQTEGQVVILLPEIVLTAQLLKRFAARFGFVPGEWHSGMSVKAKKALWQGVASGSIRLIIGARSSLFLPFAKLALIIVDEEHEAAFKQEEGVLYHARDMAVLRAFTEQIPIVLASATPSLETAINCDLGKFKRLQLPLRHGEAGMAAMEIVDMRKEQLPRHQFLSMPLRKALAATLAEGRQSMLFLNRRGYAPLTLCRSCGHRLSCPHCSSCLVEHRMRKRLECHHCGYFCRVPRLCPSCNEEDSMVCCGPGVERIAEEVAELLPGARLAVMTRDTVENSADAETLVAAILGGKIDIIIGTQMVAKGHHFPNLTLVGIVDADLGLAGGDLRAAERTYQLLHQVSGRAGRESAKGTVMVQSYMPENTIIQSLVQNRRDDFMRAEADSRKLCGLPPFCRLAAIIISGADEMLVSQAAKILAKTAPTDAGVTVLGPAPALLYQLRRKFRFRLLVKAERTVNIQKYLRYWLSLSKHPSSVRIRVDIDPYNFF